MQFICDYRPGIEDDTRDNNNRSEIIVHLHPSKKILDRNHSSWTTPPKLDPDGSIWMYPACVDPRLVGLEVVRVTFIASAGTATEVSQPLRRDRLKATDQDESGRVHANTPHGTRRRSQPSAHAHVPWPWGPGPIGHCLRVWFHAVLESPK